MGNGFLSILSALPADGLDGALTAKDLAFIGSALAAVVGFGVAVGLTRRDVENHTKEIAANKAQAEREIAALQAQIDKNEAEDKAAREKELEAKTAAAFEAGKLEQRLATIEQTSARHAGEVASSEGRLRAEMSQMEGRLVDHIDRLVQVFRREDTGNHSLAELRGDPPPPRVRGGRGGG